MGSCVSVHKTSGGSALKLQMTSLENDDNMNNNSSIPSTPVKDKDKPLAIANDPSNTFLSLRYKSQVSPFNSVPSYRSHGSKEEAFYDTQAWLESDCEDDFYSVNGDFSSRGSTPVHSAIGTPRVSRVFSPQVNRALFEGGMPPRRSASSRSRGGTPAHHRSISASSRSNGTLSEGAPVSNPDSSLKPKMKKLADLFRESIRERPFVDPTLEGYERESSQALGTSPNDPALPPKSANRTPNVSGTLSQSSSRGKRTPSNERAPHVSAQCCLPRLVPRSFSSRSYRENHKKTSTPTTPSDHCKV